MGCWLPVSTIGAAERNCSRMNLYCLTEFAVFFLNCIEEKKSAAAMVRRWLSTAGSTVPSALMGSDGHMGDRL